MYVLYKVRRTDSAGSFKVPQLRRGPSGHGILRRILVGTEPEYTVRSEGSNDSGRTGRGAGKGCRNSRGRSADRSGRCLCPGPPCFRRKRDFRSGRQKICGEAGPARQKEVRPAVYARSPGGSPASAAGGQSLPHFRTSTAAAGYRRTAAGPAG